MSWPPWSPSTSRLSRSPPSRRRLRWTVLAGGVFVGRQREIGELKAALEDVLSGWGRLVMLVGEPGIGKTRTALELSTYAGLPQGPGPLGPVLRGRGRAPLLALGAGDSLVRPGPGRRGVAVRDGIGGGGHRRDRLLRQGAAAGSEAASAHGARAGPVSFVRLCYRLFESSRSTAAVGPHPGPTCTGPTRRPCCSWSSSRGELGRSRLLLIGTYRDVDVSRQHPLSKTLGELTKAELFKRVLLRGLSQEDVGRFIEIVSGIAPPQDLVEAVHRQTEGNPLFVTEVVRLLVQEGELTRERAAGRESWSFPDSRRRPGGDRKTPGPSLGAL